jgi:voltage-dependent calcium channel L type alpha-1D
MYPPNRELQKNLDIINIFLFGVFFVEMLIKNAGLGPKNYIKDPFNIFDAIIVMVSIIDVIVTYSLPGDPVDSGKGPVSAFRAFRLLRVFKLSKSWKKLHHLLSTIARALREISSFSVLLFLLLFIYVLLGMELFAKRSVDNRNTSLTDYQEYPRANFDNFFNGFVVIFTVLTDENWDGTMFQFAKSNGYSAIFFFISFMIIGVMIFLNLFLAILLDNFEHEEEEEEEDKELANLSFSQKAQVYAGQLVSTIRSSFNFGKN